MSLPIPTISPDAIETLRTYLRRGVEPEFPFFLELAPEGIVIRRLPPGIRSPAEIGYRRARRYRIHDPFTGIELPRFRLWVRQEATPEQELQWIAPYRRVIIELLPDLERFIEENRLVLSWSATVPLLMRSPREVIEAIRRRLANSTDVVRVFNPVRTTYIIYFYDNITAMRLDLITGKVEVWFRPSLSDTEIRNPELAILLNKWLIYTLLYYSGVADTIAVAREAKNEYRRRGGVR
jgi:hypothetical protein